MNTINQRIEEIMNFYNYNPTSFANKLGINTVTMNYIINGKVKNPTYKTIIKIVEGFEDVSLEWFLRGKGEMLISQQQAKDNEDNMIQQLVKRIEALENKDL